MGELTELIRRLKGDETQVRFAERLGVEQGEVSKLVNGDRRPGRRAIIGLLRAFPQHRDEIIAALTAEATTTAGVAS